MPAKNGQQYIENLRKADNNVYIHGRRVDDVTTHPSFEGAVASMAKLYDMQHENPGKMLYTSPTTGDKVGKTFMVPETVDQLIERREAMMEWQSFTKGMMGRAPDYLNSEVMTMAKAYDFYGRGDHPEFAENARKYAEFARENDISLTHTLIHPQVNRAKIQAEQKDANVALHVVEKNDDGVVVSGIRLLATQAGITDEIFVFPSTVMKAGEKDDPYSLAFAIPNNTPGLKYLSRESFEGKNAYDHPAASRFEEGDAIVSFDNVLVPWDRVFILEDSTLCNQAFQETNAVTHMAHQVVAKDIAKTEFLLGVTLKLMDSIGIDGFQHVKDKGTEIMLTLENMKSHLYRAEHNAKLDEWGMMTPDFEALNAARNWFPRVYPRMAEILRVLGASGLMGIPTYDDFADDEIGPILNRAMQSKNMEGFERVQLFRLAWDMTLSSFGSRQTHYEYYFFGDPVKMGMAYFDQYDKEPLKNEVDDFLESMNVKRPNFN